MVTGGAQTTAYLTDEGWTWMNNRDRQTVP
jgi:hypothetical protein